MNTKQRLLAEKDTLRERYASFPDERIKILERVSEIEILLKNMCYVCGNEPRAYNEYYCSKECNDRYYAPKARDEDRKKLTTEELKAGCLRLGREARERLRQTGKV